MNNLTLPDQPGKKKSFWSRPEGKTALVINGLIAIPIIYYWGLIVPFLLKAATDTLHLMVVCGIIAAILYVAFDSNFRRFAWYLYRAMMRKITGMFVEMDPIGILKTYMEKVKGKKEELDTAIGEIRGQRIKLERTYESNKNDYEGSLRNIQSAQKTIQTSSNEAHIRQAKQVNQVESRHVVRLEGILKQQQEQLKRYEFVIEVLKRYSEICDVTILDMDNEIRIREQEREQARSFNKGMSAAFGILKGLPGDQEMYDMSIETLERQYSQQIGEVENFLEITRGIITQADFSDMSATSKAMQLLEDWESKNEDLQLGGKTKKQILQIASTGSNVITGTGKQSVPVGKKSDFEDFF